MVKNLDGFMSNLTGVTSALQIAFDSTLLALFLSAALMLVQTLVYRRSEDLLARVDRWVVEHVLQACGSTHGNRRGASPGSRRSWTSWASGCGVGIGPHVDRFAAIGRAPAEAACRLPARGRGDRPDRATDCRSPRQHDGIAPPRASPASAGSRRSCAEPAEPRRQLDAISDRRRADLDRHREPVELAGRTPSSAPAGPARNSSPGR